MRVCVCPCVRVFNAVPSKKQGPSRLIVARYQSTCGMCVCVCVCVCVRVRVVCVCVRAFACTCVSGGSGPLSLSAFLLHGQSNAMIGSIIWDSLDVTPFSCTLA